MFAARYGNIYTARQLIQLIQRAFGIIQPKEAVWKNNSGRYIDPFRPQIHPNGYESELELMTDRSYHLSCVQNAFKICDVFIFTVGLTEAWLNKHDGFVYPIAPGIVGGEFDNDKYEFKNFNEQEVTRDIISTFNFLRTINPKIKFILTVSPVALIATMEERHVLISSSYSKAVLRVATENVVNTLNNCVYFPSYEIITSPYSRGSYLENDCRSVTPEGVERVMQIFFKNFLINTTNGSALIYDGENKESIIEMERAFSLLCDEELLMNDNLT